MMHEDRSSRKPVGERRQIASRHRVRVDKDQIELRARRELSGSLKAWTEWVVERPAPSTKDRGRQPIDRDGIAEPAVHARMIGHQDDLAAGWRVQLNRQDRESRFAVGPGARTV